MNHSTRSLVPAPFEVVRGNTTKEKKNTIEIAIHLKVGWALTFYLVGCTYTTKRAGDAQVQINIVGQMRLGTCPHHGRVNMPLIITDVQRRVGPLILRINTITVV